MNTTPNIDLSKYTSDPNDKFNLLVTFNGNMDKIDTAIGSQNDQIDVIETTAGTAVTTANTASTTATNALNTANSKTSIDDNVASATTTYSSEKIDELISGAGGAVIDDTTTALDSTWSSSKINTETLNNRKIIEYLHSGQIYLVSPIASISETTPLLNYNNNELSYTVTEDSIVLGTFTVFGSTSLENNTVFGDFSPSFTQNDYSNRQNYFDLTTISTSDGYRCGIHYINTIPTIIKAGSTIKLYTNNASNRGTQAFENVKIRLKTISSILNS